MAYTGRPPAAAPLTSGDIPDGSVTAADLTNPLTKDAAAVQTLNRTTSDGDIQVFKKDGTTVGSIGSKDGNSVYYGSGNTALRFYDPAKVILPVDGTGTASDNTINLGNSTHRFKNLYLSGGVYLGGTGSANYLDDYEEGTFTPVVLADGGSYTASHAYGMYTKIGRKVIVQGWYRVGSTSSPTGSLYFTGLPFAAHSSSGTYRPMIYCMINLGTSLSSYSSPATLMIDSGATSGGLQAHSNMDNARYNITTANLGTAASEIYFNGFYFTN
jgi:hypothetical protein